MDTDDEGIDDNEFDRTTEGDDDIEEDILDALEGDLAAAAEENSDADDVCLYLIRSGFRVSHMQFLVLISRTGLGLGRLRWGLG